MSLGGEDVVIDVDGELAFLRKEQVEVFEHLSQKEGIHPGQTDKNGVTSPAEVEAST